MDFNPGYYQTELHSSPVSFTPHNYDSLPKSAYYSEDFRYQQYYEVSNSNINERYALGKSTGSESVQLGSALLNLPSGVIVTDPENNSIRIINARCHDK